MTRNNQSNLVKDLVIFSINYFLISTVERTNLNLDENLRMSDNLKKKVKKSMDLINEDPISEKKEEDKDSFISGMEEETNQDNK